MSSSSSLNDTMLNDNSIWKSTKYICVQKRAFSIQWKKKSEIFYQARVLYGHRFCNAYIRHT